MMISWTDEERELVFRLWAQPDMTASRIALQMGRTRNAVIGVINRGPLRKAARAYGVTPARRPGGKRLTRAEFEVVDGLKVPRKTPLAPPLVAKKAAPAPVPREVGAGPVTLFRLKEHHCRWPLGDPRHAGFAFCGDPKLPATPYCSKHTLLGLTPEGQARFRRQLEATAA